MRRFVLKSGIQTAMIPGAGRVTQGSVLEGDAFARYVPSMLTEILDATPVAPPPPMLVEPAPSVPVVESEPLVEESKKVEEPRRRGRSSGKF